MHTCHLRHTHDIVQSCLLLLLRLRLLLLFLVPFLFLLFFSLTCMPMCALLSLKIFSKRAYKYIASIHTHTNIVTSTYVSIIFYHLLFLLSIYLALFITLHTISFFYCPYFMAGKITKYSIEDFF
jgi:hypothetical protein